MSRYERFNPSSLVVTKNVFESGDQSSSEPTTPGPRSICSEPISPLICNRTRSSLPFSTCLARPKDLPLGERIFRGFGLPAICDQMFVACLLYNRDSL